MAVHFRPKHVEHSDINFNGMFFP